MAAKEVEWDLAVEVLHMGARKVLRVRSDWSVGHVLNTLSSKLLETNISHYGLWWPEQRLWLRKHQQSLHGYGVMSDAKIQLLNLNHRFYVELPDKSVYKCVMNFSRPVFEVVMELCRRMSIRRPEELSLLKFREDCAVGGRKKKKKVEKGAGLEDGTYHPDVNYGYQPEGVQFHRQNDSADLFAKEYTKNLKDLAYINSNWLESNRSLYEQDVFDEDHLYLRFKYHAFLDLNPQLDDFRIRQLFEQAKWSVLCEEVDCTEEEAMTFAALQFQVTLAYSQNEQQKKENFAAIASDIDQQLMELKDSLGQTDTDMQAPAEETFGYMRLTKGGFTLRGPKRYWFMLQGVTLCEYKTSDDSNIIDKYNLKGAVSEADLDPAKNKYAITLQLESGDDIRVLCDNADEYVKWMASFKIAGRGEIITESKLEREKASVNAFIAMQVGKNDTNGATPGAANPELQPNLLVSQSFIKKYKSKMKDLSRKIVESHASIPHLSLIEAQMEYISNWAKLQNFGISYFLVQFTRPKRDALLGIAFDRLIAIDINTFAQVKVWRYPAMERWKINWKTREMRVIHEEGDFGFTCLSCDPTVVHEFIGGNVFLFLRDDPHTPLNLEVFQQLTLDKHKPTAHSGWGEEQSARN
ncbi:Fermitin [Oopsacas minuta]|uniref:Fermitin n=1 Tax=Oopsacas minuta TaxID=111878 RepID=A0AAV7K8N0_9METZ|nr:Fermitin [Oopsacas minuta]